MQRKLSILIVLLISSLAVKAGDTLFVGKGGKINDVTNGNLFPITISGMKPSNINATYGLESVNINIKSASDGALVIYLGSPDGNYWLLSDLDGGAGKNFDSTTFSDTALQAIHLGKAPFKGIYTPQCFLRQVNNGQSINGTWNLYVLNSTTVKDVVVRWSLKFGTDPLRDYSLDSSNLPIFVFNTQGNIIQGYDPMAASKMHLIENGPGKYNHLRDSSKFRGFCGLEIRGNYSRQFPKLSYSLEVRDTNQQPFDTSILGMPKAHDWALVANYSDRSLLRNSLAQYMFTSMGNYSPRFRNVEVVLNGVYQGVYLLIEKIKRDKNRVNIAKLDPGSNSGDSMTGGYVIKVDWKGNSGWYSPYSVLGNSYYYPYYRWDLPVSPSSQQQAYIQDFYDSFENAMYGKSLTSAPGNWRNFMDEKSLGDFFLVQEMSQSLDGYRSSFYMWKDKNSIDRHIHMGPVWDFDWGFYNYAGCSSFSGWLYQNTSFQPGFWWSKLNGYGGYGKGDANYKDNLKCKWTIYRRGVLNLTTINHFIDSNVAELNDAQKRNFKEWSVWGMNTGIYAVGQPTLAKNYAQEIDTLKGWISRRLKWIDKKLPGTCRRDIDAPTVSLNGKDTTYLEVNTTYKDSGITYHDNYGDTNVIVTKGTNLDTSQLGIYYADYFLSDKAGNKSHIQRVIIVIDTIAPQISFLHGDSVTTEVLEQYKDTDVIIQDNYDISPVMTKSGNFNFANNIPDTLGYFTMWYKGVDYSGNKDSLRRTIYVVDTLAPVISLEGRDSVFLTVNDSIAYIDSGYIAIDNYDRHLKIDTTGTYKDTRSAGTYFISYQAMDQSSNKSSIVSRVITVSTVKDTSSGIESLNSLNGSIRIYPNPGSGLFQISIKLNSNTKASLSVTDEMGRELQGQGREINNGWTGLLHLENEPAGMYILKLQTGSSVSTRKLFLLK